MRDSGRCVNGCPGDHICFYSKVGRGKSDVQSSIKRDGRTPEELDVRAGDERVGIGVVGFGMSETGFEEGGDVDGLGFESVSGKQ